MNADLRFKPSPHISWSEIEGAAVLVDPQEGKIFHLNPVGTEIWKNLSEGRNAAEVIASLQDHFDGSTKQIHRDVLHFFKQLHRDDLISPA